ncbi:unnamed protein product [Clonostachys rosea f. rosea IK726]|uniref:Uncharacterized protein n=1 Tax=Clonostachys rosea f. rosea IK726 TaxID=1349383 RepID=A0ACA9TBY5_BIOOC|nr:unnamed protein product [Clonostachys rosea f. rosea IK726]
MSTDGSFPGPSGSGDANPRNRRGSITQAALSNLFQRSGPSVTGPPFPGQPNPAVSDPQRRRLSVSTLGLSGASPNVSSGFGMRRGSMSTNSNNSDSIDESAIEDDDFGPKTAPTTPFTRRMSFGNSSMRGYRPGGSPGHALAGRRASVEVSASSPSQASHAQHIRFTSDTVPRLDQQGFNWPEQLRSRAESHVAGGQRPSFSLATSPPQHASFHHDRAKSVSDMPPPPNHAPAPKPVQERPKPDAFQERILKGDFYMD